VEIPILALAELRPPGGGRSGLVKFGKGYNLAMPEVDIRRSSLGSPDGSRLIAALNAELTAPFPEPGANHFSISEAQVQPGDGAFVVAYLDGAAVGCGAIRRVDEATAELKRMYVDPSLRGRGIGRAIVDALESEARQLRVSRVVLETGTRLTSAIQLYERMGYKRIPLYGEYLLSPETSVCFGKTLTETKSLERPA
jgi:putative acetyltransferase